MTILDRIIAYKEKEVAVRAANCSIEVLKGYPLYQRECYSLSDSLNSSANGIIAEHKRKSPSKSVINDQLKVIDVATAYEKAGVAAMSVLTDTPYFGGCLDDLMIARNNISIPILRKDFTIHPYQVHEAKAYGADAILLIAACLSQDQNGESKSSN